MSPPNDRNGFINDPLGGYQQSFANAVHTYQTNVPPKKSFCIDALLSKNHQANGDQSPDGGRFLSDDDTANKYSDDQREYMSSPEDEISRYFLGKLNVLYAIVGFNWKIETRSVH